jgi:mRNA interferase RelE/StbE
MENKFIIKMDPDAYQEYNKLDNSIIEEVDKALESLEQRADEVGKPLGNKYQIDLTGSKEKKLRGPGVRIVYTITKEFVEVLQIVVVLIVAYKKDDKSLYKDAQRRFTRVRGEIANVTQLPSWSSPVEEVSEPFEINETDTSLYYTKQLIGDEIEIMHEIINSVVGKGANLNAALQDLGEKLFSYSKEYLADFNTYYNQLETIGDFPYVVRIIEIAGENEEIHRIVDHLVER